jgi:hypothetical protein
VNKDEFRKRLADDVDQFLREGGQIKSVESKRVCPAHMQWIARRGMDYSTWDEIGGDDWERRDGTFKLDPEDFEEE